MLDNFGKLAIAEIIAYVPVVLVAFFVTLRHGFTRKAGWVLLLTFSLIRIVGSILTVAAQEESNPSVGLLTAAGTLQALGLSPLLLATLSFITRLVNKGLPNLSRPLHLVRIALVVGVILAVIGGIDQSPGHSQSDQNSGHTLSKVGSLCFLGGYLALFGVHLLLWGVKSDLSVIYCKFLRSISIALPFLAVRVIYSVLSAFNRPGSKFSATSGDWKIYLFMALLMEYIVVCIYIISGITIPQEEDDSTYEPAPTSLENLSWKPRFNSRRY